MEVIAEIEPTRSYEKLINFMNAVKDLADWVDVPEAPLGKPRALSIVVSTVIQKDFKVPAIAHVRVQDHNLIALHNIMGATRIANIRRVVLLRGDPLTKHDMVNPISPEEAIDILREENRAAEAGLLLSLRKGREKILERLRSGADFFLVLNSRSPEDLVEYLDVVKKRRLRLIPYILVLTEKNKDLLMDSLPHAPKFKLKDLYKVLSDYKEVVDSVLISVPGDLEGLRKALKVAKEI